MVRIKKAQTVGALTISLAMEQRNDLMSEGTSGKTVALAFDLLEEHKKDLEPDNEQAQHPTEMNLLAKVSLKDWSRLAVKNLRNKEELTETQAEDIRLTFLVLHAFPNMKQQLVGNPRLILGTEFKRKANQFRDPVTNTNPMGSTDEVKSLHQLKAVDNSGREVDLSEWAGKVVLVVNVASQCGFTPQYKALQALHDRFHEKGFLVAGFPCNQFGGQEPGSDEEIASFCSKNYGVAFPIMAKIEVNGQHVHPVYDFLKAQRSGLLGLRRIKWNFEKFLVDKKGRVHERYSSLTSPESLVPDIEKLLAEE